MIISWVIVDCKCIFLKYFYKNLLLLFLYPQITEWSFPKRFQKDAVPYLPFHRMNSDLVAPYSKSNTFLPFSKKREKGCLFMVLIYILNMSFTFKLKSAFGNQKCALRNIKSAIFLFSAPYPFFSLRETLHNNLFLQTQNEGIKIIK